MGSPVVALVLVSHSRMLAEGVAELAGQMAPDVALVPAGGTEDGGLGTGFDRILTAVESAVAEGRSAVVLTDLGSAVLTTESVLEMLDPDVVAHVRVADAPLVEGAVEAAVVAQGGAGLDAVHEAAEHAGAVFAEAARGAARARVGEPPAEGEQLSVRAARGAARTGSGAGTEAGVAGSCREDAGGQSTPHGTSAPTSGGPADPATTTPPIGGGVARGTAVLRNRLGLHARPAASLARTAGAFASTITVNGADARSVLALVALGAVGGSELVVAANGPDARTAVNAVVAELEEGFGEA